MLSQVTRILRRFTIATVLSAGAATVAMAQGTGTIRGRVTDAAQNPLSDVQVQIAGMRISAVTTANGTYTVPNVPAGTHQVLARRFGYTQQSHTVVVSAGAEARADFQLAPTASQLDAVVVTALGQTTEQRSIGTAQQSVAGADIAETQRENFINSLQGRVAGVDVTSTSGAPGASTLITIRGISSISSSNQPLMIVDGLPIDNKTTNTANLASDAPTSALAFNNRNVDFTNRAADINPEDIESLTVLKGPEAAALYGIDAANGAIVITTKRGRAGASGFTYSNDFRMESVRAQPQVQDVYGPNSVCTPSGSTTTFCYFGTPYPSGTKFYDNIGGFFKPGFTSKNNLAFTGGSPDSRVSYHISGSQTKQDWVVPNSNLNKVNLTGAMQGQAASWLIADLSMMYASTVNAQPFKGDNGPLIGLLAWPDTNNASNWLTPAGTRQRLTTASAGAELDNPYFSVNKNHLNAKTNRVIVNSAFTVTPFSWGYFKTNIGADAYTTQNLMVRHPESSYAYTYGGILDINDDVSKNVNVQTLFNVNSQKLGKGFSISGLVGNAVQDNRDVVDGSEGIKFLDPNFISINNTSQKYSRTIETRRRLVGAYGEAVLNYNDYLYLTGTGRNDWTSTIPQGRNSFFYPSLSASFVFTDAFPSLQRYMTGKLRAAYAEVGRDAQPYSYRTTLESKVTSFGGYGYGFYGPNPLLEPEFAKDYEYGTELSFLENRLGLDFTSYRKRTENQIVQNVRESYGTGYILFNLNGATTENKGIELTMRATPVESHALSWDIEANLTRARGKTVSLPNNLPESYNSDTWLYGNIRNGTEPGLSTMSLTGTFYARNKDCQLLIDPTSGLPIRSGGFVDAKCVDSRGNTIVKGYDRQPNFTVGLSNSLRYKKFSLSGLVDIRRGGDVFNATEHYLTTRGLATSTLDRWTPRVIPGVIRDGKENSTSPTPNNIVVIPGLNTNYYTNMSEELFIERNINWVRLRDITLRYELPETRYARSASLFVSGTDLFLWTNYTGLDPIANGTDAASGGSGGIGIDYGNFPIPRGINFGLRMGF